MTHMVYLLTTSILLTVLGMTVKADESYWETDFMKARESAGKKNKPILAVFSGSDWCGWCIKLDNEVLGRKEFLDYVNEHFVLLMVDFPAHKSQSEPTKIQNQLLMKRYNIQGLPMVLILDAEGRIEAATGYRHGGAEKYIEYLKSLLEDIKVGQSA